MTFPLTSKNRTAARRILNVWHDSADVRTWTLAELDQRLAQAVSQDLITNQAVVRALAAETAKTQPNDGSDASDDNDDGNSAASTDDPRGDDGDASSTPFDAADSGDVDGDAQSDSAQSDGAQSDGDGQSDGAGADPNDGMPAAPNADSVPPNMPFVTHEELDASNTDIVGKLSKYSQDCALHVLQHSTARLESFKRSVDARLAEVAQAKPEKARKLKVTLPSGKTTKVKGAHCMLESVLKYIAAGLNVALVGPAGSGKSTLVAHACEALDREFTGTGAVMSKYDLIGYKDASGVYHETPLFDAYVNGKVFCFDEFDGSAPDAAVAFNGITDNQPVYAFPNGMQKKHADFVGIACMNTWGNGASADYVGRYKQDAAAMSRFVKVLIDYDRKLEAQLGDADIVAHIHKVRDAVNAIGIRHVVSTRMIVQAQAAREVGIKNAIIDRDIVFAGLDDDAIKQIKGSIKS